MKKKIISLLLVLVFVVSLTSCFKDERNYDYKDLTEYLTLPKDYKGHVVDVEQDYINQQIASYIKSYATSLYKAVKGDDIYVNLKFAEVSFLDTDKTKPVKGNAITGLDKTNFFIDELGDGNYNKTIEDLIITWGVEITKAKEEVVTLPNDEMYGEYAGKQVYLSCEFVNMAVSNGDIVKVKYTGYRLDDNGEIKLNDKGEKDTFDSSDGTTFFIGANLAIEDFENGMIGMLLGDANKKQIKATFPDDYASEEFKGKTVIFEITILDKRIVPTYDDKFVEKFQYKTTKEFEESLISDYAYNSMSEYLIEKSTYIKFPKKEYKALKQQFEDYDDLYATTQYGSFENFVLIQYGMTKDEYIKTSMKPNLIFYTIAQVENFVPKSADLATAKESLIKEFTEQYKQSYSNITDAEARHMAIEYVEQYLGTAAIYEEAIFDIVDKYIRTQYTVNLVDAKDETVIVRPSLEEK